mgnify:CR=1 FL=1
MFLRTQGAKSLKLADLFGKTFHIVRNNLILVQPLLFFMLLAGVFSSSLSGITTITPAAIVLIISNIALFCAFLAGWYHMIHKSIVLQTKPAKSEEERAVESVKLFNEFIPGVGRYFLDIVIGLILFFVLLFIVMNITGFIGQHYIGIPEGITKQDLSTALINEENAIKFLNSISNADKIKISKWYILTMTTSGLFSYLTMFWAPAIIAGNNPFKAYLISLKTVLKRPIATISIFLSFWISAFFISIINSLSMNNFLLQFLGLVLFVLSILYFTLMNFLYYDENSENNSTSWTNSFR